MGLDMSVYKYNKGMDEETFQKVKKVQGINVEESMKFMEAFNKFKEETGNNYESPKFIEFCHEYGSEHMTDMLDVQPLTIEQFKESFKEDTNYTYQKYLIEWDSNYRVFLKQIHATFQDNCEEIVDMLAIYAEVQDILEGLDYTEIAYWRKHSDLNGYMEELYYEKGGDGDFNCVPLYLSKEDVEQIIDDHKKHLDPEDDFTIGEARGFFWGATEKEDWEESLKDFEKILNETDWDNETVYYSCWW